jgi:predicted nucleic acid-binding protein
VSELRTSTGTPIVIDSSVAAKWFLLDEPGATKAHELLLAHRDESVALVAPALLPLEVVNALACRGLMESDLLDAVAALDAVDLLIAPLDRSLLSASVRVASEDGMTVYDALFVALAEMLGATLVTADRRQASTQRCPVRLIGH